MDYVNREAEAALAQLARQFKVVLVTGARQVGKTTMVRHALGGSYGYVTLDGSAMRTAARSAPADFLLDHPAPVVIDEVQKAPGLFGELKAAVDERDGAGLFVLTGSQTFGLMKGVRESLAGRVGVLEMSGFSARELSGSDRRGPHVPGSPWRRSSGERPTNTWEAVWRGSAPALADPAASWSLHYTNYVSTYIERDVRDVLDIRDEERFYRFVRLCAARTGQVVNYSDLCRDAGLSDKTAKAWVSVLRGSGIVRLLDAFAPNTTKALSKSPKLYFTDTGLACHLLGITTPQALEASPLAGALFETFAVSEVMKSYLNAGLTADALGYYRETTGRRREVDLVVREGNVLYPIEVKSGTAPGEEAVRHFGALADLPGYELGAGEVVCRTADPYSLSPTARAVSVWDI
jgi:hypothetical protein